MAFDSKQFRRTLGQFATGVTVITLWTPEGELHGMTANAFSSVSLDPPLILVCIDKRNTTHRLIPEVRRFAVNILSEEQTLFSRYFAGEKELEPPIEIVEGREGAPVLKGVIAWLDCTLWQAYDGGDHTIYVGEVQDLSADGGRPLLFFNGAYGRIDSA